MIKKSDNDESNDNISTIRQRLRTIQNRIMQLENAGLDDGDGDEIEDLEMECEDLFNGMILLYIYILSEDLFDIILCIQIIIVFYLP